MLRFLLCGLLLAGGGLLAAPAADRPNVLFLFADDLTHDAIRALGDLDIETPNLDRLAARSKVFTRAYNMGSWSAAVCVASRTMLNTGKQVWHAGREALPQALAQQRLWPQRLAARGYQTYLTGKWHVAADARRAFEQTGTVRAGMPKDTPSAYHRPVAGQPDAWSPADPDLGGYWQGGRHWSEVTADEAAGFLRERRDVRRPFFMYVAFNAPHDPRQSPAEFVARYPLSRIALPASFQPEYPFKDRIGCGPSLRDEKLAPFPRTAFAVKTHRAEYFALITHLDAQIGRVLEALEATGEAERTWVFFTADHGLAVGKHGLLGKQSLYEHSLRVPFLVRGPGIAPGKVPQAIHLQDAMATTLDLAGASMDGVEFRSLLPLLRGESDQPTAEPVYGAYLDLQRAILTGGWKLIAYPQARRLRLYHVAEDPEELHDLAAEPAQQDRLRQLFRQLQAAQKRLDDPLDLRPAFPDL